MKKCVKDIKKEALCTCLGAASCKGCTKCSVYKSKRESITLTCPLFIENNECVFFPEIKCIKEED